MPKFLYPDEVVLRVGDERREFLKGKSEVIKTLDEEWYPTEPLPLRKDVIFRLVEPKKQQRLWELFLDLFALVPTPRKVFHYTNNGTTIVPSRGTMQEVIDMLDFLLIERNKEEIIEYLRQQAREQVNAPPAKVPKGVRIRTPGSGAQAFAARQAALLAARRPLQRENENNFGSGNGNNNFWENNNNEEGNTRPAIRVNNNEGNNYENFEEENQEENLVQTSRARGPLLNFSQLLNTAKAKNSTKGGLRKKHRTQRRRRTHKK